MKRFLLLLSLPLIVLSPFIVPPLIYWLNVLFVSTLLFFLPPVSSNPFESPDANIIHLVPNDFEGELLIVYNVKGKPKIKSDNGFINIPYNEDGFYLTSTAKPPSGSVNNKYYYVFNGQKTEIVDRNICVQQTEIGGFQLSEHTPLYKTYNSIIFKHPQGCSFYESDSLEAQEFFDQGKFVSEHSEHSFHKVLKELLKLNLIEEDEIPFYY